MRLSSGPTWLKNFSRQRILSDKRFSIDGRPFEVIGIGKAKGSVFGQPQDMYVAMPLSTFWQFTVRGDRSISVLLPAAPRRIRTLWMKRAS